MPTYHQDPARYYMQQQSRRDQQIRDLLNMFMMMKQQKYGREQDTWERQMKERQLAMDEPYKKGLTDYHKAMAEKARRDPVQPSVPYWQTPEAIYDRDQARKRHAQAAEDRIQGEVDKQAKKQSVMINSVIRRYEKERKRLSDYLKKQVEAGYGTMPNLGGKEPSKLKPKEVARYQKATMERAEIERAQSQIEAINFIMDRLYSADDRAKLGQVISPATMKRLNALLGNPSKLVEMMESGNIADLLGEVSSLETKPEEEFKVGETRIANDGNTWRYLGNDKWEMVK